MHNIHLLLERYFGKYAQTIRYIFAGGTAVIVDLIALYIAKDVLGLSLIPAVSVGFFCGFCTGFLFHKFWTFRDASTDKMHVQAAIYFCLTILNFLLNLILMYILVEKIHIWYIFSKILVSGGIAFVSFFMYRGFVFGGKKSQ